MLASLVMWEVAPESTVHERDLLGKEGGAYVISSVAGGCRPSLPLGARPASYSRLTAAALPVLPAGRGRGGSLQTLEIWPGCRQL